MSDRDRKPSKTLVPTMPKDIPMPKYRYQDDRLGADRKSSDSEQRAAKILADARLVCCAAMQTHR